MPGYRKAQSMSFRALMCAVRKDNFVVNTWNHYVIIYGSLSFDNVSSAITLIFLMFAAVDEKL